MEADVWGVRISPPFLEFLDVKVGFTYRGTVTVKNISKTSKRLRINGPVSKLFKLSVANQDKPIAPGLMLTAVVEYIPEKDEDFRDRLILLADEDVIEIPLLAMCPSCYLEIETEVDFGFVVANSRLISKEIEISNHGSAPGVFKIYSVSNLPVKIQPPSGIVQPKTTQKIKFELTTDKATNFEEFVKVKLQDSEDVVIKIKADIVEQVLELLNTANQRIECVRFGAAYFGTSKLQQAVLYNNSPQAINWVAILQDDAEGADVGNDWDSSTDATLLEMRIRQKLDGIDIAMLISCFPNQGSLGPYEKTTVILHFSPIYNSVNEPKKQDYALFMKFEIVGSKESFIQETSRKYLMKKERGHNHVELALTGTGLPVILMATPAPPYDFKECYMGEQVDIQCSLQNQSLLLPVLYSSRKTANFSIFPSKGKINPGMQQDVVLSFVPHQAGTFKVNQLIDIFGPVALPSNNSVHLKSRPFHQISLSFTGVCKPTAKQMVAKFNPGIKSSFTNESGQFFEVNSEQLRNYNSSARMALLCATKTGIHTHRRSKSLEKNVLVSFPDDRATSIKQSSRNELYRTIFTKTLRYNYVDPDYAYTEEEDEQRKAHREYYAHFLKSLREQRLQKEKDREMGDVKGKDDLGMKSAAGIFPKKLLLGDIEVNQQVEVVKSTLLTTRRLAAIESRSTSRPVTDGLNVVPTTQEETEDCKMTLSAQQLHQIIIGPSVVDFGEVCLHSISSKPLNIVNNLPVHIWVQFEIDCLELQQTSPLSHVVPPMSRAFLPIIFETNDLGKFQRSVTYTINKNHVGHVLVLGQVVPVTLELSTQELILTPNSCFLAESGFRSTITLRNPQNHPAEFTWKPIITENGIAFSIRPATGSVDAYRELECEVVWHPSYYSPVDGEFDLIVHEGNTARLKCLAMLGSTSVEFTEKHVVFGSVAQNLTAIKTATLQNNGQNHAYFQVFDPNPLPGMTIIPSEGVVPVGGSLDLVLYFIPDAVMKFDTRVEVGIRNTKSSELRIGGSVEMPQVEIDVKNFRFPGVYSGSVQEIPFTLQNKTAVRARVEFDLSDHPEFAIKFIDCTGTCKGSNIFLLDMEENESLECSLVFSPREVAAYDFSLPVNINSAVAPSPPPSSLPKTPSIIEKHLVTPRPHTIAVTTPSRRIQATVLQPPLEVSKMELKFEVPAEFSNTELFPESINTQTFEMKNISQKEVSWMIDLTKENSYFDEGIFKIYQQAGTLQPDEKISITVDEATDISCHAQLSVIIRYVDSAGKIQECFIGFLDVSGGRDAQSVFEVLKENMQGYSFREKLVAQTYDGAAVFASSLNGPQAKAKSTQRMSFLESAGSSSLPRNAPTRWNFTSRIVSTVANNYDGLLQTFDKITQDESMDDDTLVAAKGFIMKLEDFEFVLMLYTYEQIFSETDVVFDIVQQRTMDVLYCKKRIGSLLAFVKEKRSDEAYQAVYAKDPQDRYRNLYMAILDNLMEQISQHFSNLESMSFLELVNPGKFDEMRQVFPEEAFESGGSGYVKIRAYDSHVAIFNLGLFTRESGIYNLNVPIFINDDYIHPFRSITLSGVIKIPKIIFDPPSLILAPVPLETEVGAMISIIPSEYIRNCFVNVELPEIELEDGTNIKPFTLKFLSGQQIITLSNGKNKILTCQIIFKSSRPVSDVSDIVFIDEHQQRFVLSVVATADNCLLTAYPYLALHLSDQQIVLKSGCLNGVNSKQNTGEAILHPCYTPATHSRSTSSSSTFIVLSSTCDESFPESAEENLNGSVKKSDEIDQQGFKNIFGFPTFPMENTEEGHFFRMMLYAVQKWFSLFGWPKGPRPISIPESLRSGVCKNQSSGSSVRKSSFRSSRGKEANTVYDMLFHLSGQVLQGITTTQALPTDHTKRVLQLHWQHSSLITFLKAHGACLAYIRPEFLFEPDDFKHWNSIQSQLGQLQNKKANGMDKPGDISLTGIEDIYFESLSKRAWTDVLLQIYKVFVLSQIQTQGSNTLAGLEYMENIPKINPDPLSSNIYSTSERKLLTWLNLHYEKMRNTVWKKISKGEAPPGRWIINFDLDLLDGVVLATVLASYCPFLISTHLVNIYTNPTSLEQCLHNALLLVKAFHAINLEIDVQATDISDPNPIMMIMLCVYLYEKLPQYVPKKTIEFSVGLHCSSIRQVLLKNTSSKALVYTATIIGKESEDFVIVKGNTVTIAPRGQTNVTVEFTSRFLRPVESILLLTAKLSTGPHGGTLVFTLRSNITSITSSGVIKCSSPCYELNKCHVTTTNPFKKDGEFRVILLESKNSLAKVGPQEFLRNLDLKCSYPMSGSEFYSRDIASLDNNQDTSLGTTGQVNQLNEFFSPVESVFLECRGSANIEIHYLPFHLGKRYCSILFLNEKVGEFLYSVEGESTLPLPQPLIPVESSHIAHISGAGKGKRSEKPVLIFKCLMDSCLEEKLKIPLVNEAREKALAAVAQQRMSFVEFERRKITGTLQSSSVRAAMAALGLSETETRPVPATLENKYRSIDYKVEVSMPEHFKFPKKISIPVSTTSANSLKSTLLAVKTTEDAVEIPLIFHPKAPGRYPCQIVLHSSRDVRVHLIECVVNSEETEADLMFVTPALQTVTQDIPISNKTLQEWSIQGVIEGNGFYGPSVINVRAGEKVQYPLMFKPMCEGITLGKLTLQNYTDGTRQIFGLRGVGKKPLAFDHAVIDCRVGQLAQKVLMVPNFTQTRLICKVVSDLAIVSGFPFLELKPGQSTSYTISIDPRRRGKQTGVISFVAEDGEDQQPPHNKAVNQTDGKQAIQRLAGETFSALDDSKEVSHIYKVWFSLEIIAAPPPSVQIIAVKCPIHTKTTVDIPISNPSNETMHLDVLLRGAGLSGDSYLVLKPMEKVSYLVSYFSSFTGRATGSVIFQSDKVAEFWYELDLTTEKPLPTIFPPLQCELGKWTRHFIPLVNPTDETLQLQAFNSNPKHFSVELGPKKSLTMAPHSSANVPVHFCPSALGRANHKTSVSFKCRQVEEWKFLLSGIGLVPGTMEPLSISTSIGSHASVIVPFRNPTDHNVVVDVVLTDKEGSSSDFQETISSSVFSLPLQETYGIRLTPKGRLDIPVIFAPNSLQLSESAVVIQIKKENGDPWSCPQLNESDPKVQNAIIFGTEGSVIGIRWVYPIHGIPEAPLSKSSPAVIKCQARERIEEHIEVLLTGSVPGSSTDLKTKSETNNVQNIHIQDNIQNEVQVTDGSATAEEFYHEIQFQSDADKAQLEASVALCLQRKERDPNTGIVTLVFSIIFAPYKPYRCSAVLAVQCATGGKWKFPIQLIATEPKVDDVITIEAAGLNKTSMVGFRLTSQTRNPEPFTAYFMPASGQEFEVSPQSGELLPIDTAGTLITVSFTPSMYSKKHRATLVIQTSDMQWMYEIHGVQPRYVPPTSQASKTVTSVTMRTAPVKQRNFIRENLELTTTSVSSPIKGRPLVSRTK
ncbi:cilia- and flagella-associated protein 47-like [Polypterus senegalus]|uniref:cilia- and flagella-associated protein 47-like n=1 Tax=Polypterus senegalus TaxID=55291 RepID=UPI0019665029|nr:cilia- and flagella-associated protein 47-like [Polypterus senegalus]